MPWRAGAQAVAAVLAVFGPVSCVGYASYVKCNTSLTDGNMMGFPIAVSSTSGAAAQLAKDGSVFACGSSIEAGGTFEVKTTGISGQYVIEAVASSGTGEWGVSGGDCDQQRLRYSRDKAATPEQSMYGTPKDSYTAPPSGTVTMRVAWASTYTQVQTSPDCVYHVVSSEL